MVSALCRFDTLTNQDYNVHGGIDLTASFRSAAEATAMGCSPLRIVIFDLDDTLYPRSSGMMAQVARLILRYMTERLGMEPETAKTLRQAYLRDYGTTMAGLVRHNDLDADDYLEYVHNLSVTDYLAPNPELGRVLQAIPQQKAIWTNASRGHACRVLDALAVRDHFTRIIDVIDTGYVSKPAPHIYADVLSMLDATGPECVLVEDSLRNLQPAKHVGMHTVLVGGDGDETVDICIPRIEQVADAVSKLRHGPSTDRMGSSAASE